MTAEGAPRIHRALAEPAEAGAVDLVKAAHRGEQRPLVANEATEPINVATADRAADIPHVAIGIVALGHVLFGIMHRPVIAAVGAGLAAAFYIPSYVAGDAALAVSAALMLGVVGIGAAWIRTSGVP